MPRTPSPEPKVRLSLEITQVLRDTMGRLRELTGADSITEVIRHAVNIYGILVERTAKGDKIILRRANGTEQEIILVQ
jgi:hypothetical protein